MFKANPFSLFLFAIVLVIALPACSSLKNVGAGEYVLTKNKLEFDTKISNRRLAEVKKSLERLYKQQPTKRNIFNPRTWGSKSTIYDRELTEETAQDFRRLLINRKGFYKATVEYAPKFRGQEVEVSFKIVTGPQYYIDSISYTSEDQAILTQIKSSIENASISKGMPLDARDFDSEKDRIVNLLQNSGYANFTKNFIEYRGDSLASGAVAVNIFIYSPADSDHHQKYVVGDVKVFTEHLNGEETPIGIMDTLEGVEYFARDQEYVVIPKGITNAIALKEGTIYRKEMETKTYTRLTALSPYRFALINPIIDNNRDSIINFNIFLTPQDKKWTFDAGTNLFYSTFSAGGRNNLLGFNSTVSLVNRNFLKRAYRYYIDLEGTFEFDFSNFPNIDPNTISFQLNNRLEVPRKIEIFSFFRWINKMGLLKDELYEKFDKEALTEVAVGYGYNDIIDLYLLNSINVSWSYNFQPSPYTRIRFNQVGFNYVSINTDPMFEEQFLDVNPLLRASFTNQLFTGVLFRDIAFIRQSRESLKQIQWTFISNLEISGLENYLVNSIVNVARNGNDYWQLGNVAFAKYIRLDNDIRFYKRFKGKRVFAARLNVALAFPYGADENIEGDGLVPFVKQYFVGGPNSLRAWRLRELGPGSFSDYLINPLDVPPFQAGDFKIDMSAEYRFKLFWLLDGALFMDAGNVWLLKDNPENPGGKISSKFLNQFAVGAGWGLRMDFSYFILRFDMGYKLRNPFPDPETGSYKAFNSTYNSFPLGNINFAINYPF